MSWWRRLLPKQRTSSTPPNDLVGGVLMTIPGWHEDARQDKMRTWHHPDGAVLSLAAASRAAIPPLSRLDLLRNAFRRLAEGGRAGLVQADVLQSPYGPAAQMIYKRRQGMGFIFTGMLFLPAGAQWLVCTVVAAEVGTTGIREAVVTAQLLQAGTLTVASYEESWAQDPYDAHYRSSAGSPLRYLSDDASFDAQFPEHPLSIVRRTFNGLLKNVFMDQPAVKQR